MTQSHGAVTPPVICDFGCILMVRVLADALALAKRKVLTLCRLSLVACRLFGRGGGYDRRPFPKI